MGVGTLNNRSAGQTILDTFFNDIHGALDGDFVGRDSSGVAASGQNLGTAAYPWGTVRATTLVLAGSAVDTSKLTSPVNRIISAKLRSSSNQPAFITPNGAAASFILKGATTNLVVDINGTPITVSTDITKSSLTVAPSSQNTCLVNDTEASGQEDTRLWGEVQHRKAITIDTAGTNITSKVGKYAAFKIGTEYFIALVESSTKLSHAYRGFYFDSSLNPLNRTKFSNNDTITLMSLGWVFVDQDAATIDVSYANPKWSFTSPSAPSTGDYWYDLANKMWKRYDGATFVIINRIYVGQVIIDTTNCVAARCVDVYGTYKKDNDLRIDLSTTEIAIASKPYASLNVAGFDLQFGFSLPTWNITTDLAGSADMYNAAEQASTLYYLYVKDTGAVVISDISPYFRLDLFGEYHPHNPWRCVGAAVNDGSSNFVQAGGRASESENKIYLSGGNGMGAVATGTRRFTNIQERIGAAVTYSDDANAGAAFTVNEDGVYAISLTDGSSTLQLEVLISQNSDDTTASLAISAGKILASLVIPNSRWSNVSWTGYLPVGTIIRPQGEAGLNRTADGEVIFTISKVAASI